MRISVPVLLKGMLSVTESLWLYSAQYNGSCSLNSIVNLTQTFGVLWCVGWQSRQKRAEILKLLPVLRTKVLY